MTGARAFPVADIFRERLAGFVGAADDTVGREQTTVKAASANGASVARCFAADDSCFRIARRPLRSRRD